MNFEKLYSESGFIRDLAFKKLFLEILEFLNFVYEYSLQLLVLPFDDTIDLLDNNVNDNINIKIREIDLLYESSKYLVNIEGNSQTSVSVNLKNLSYLCALLLRQVKTAEEDKIKNVIQININNHSPFKIKDFINITKLIDSITGEVRNGQIAKEVGFDEGKAIGLYEGKTIRLNEGRNKGIAIGLDKGKREIILRMLNNNVSDSNIIKYSGVTESELEDIKKSIGK